MAYETNSLKLALETVDHGMSRLKLFVQQASAQMAAGNVDAAYIINSRYRMIKAKAEFDSLKNTPGLIDYAKAEKNEADYNIAQEFAFVIAAMDAYVAAVESQMPSDGNGYLLAEKFNATGTEQRMFTPAQTAGVRTLLNAIAATIN